MAETHQTIEREYTIPLKKEWRKVPSYKRARKSIIAIKQFVARHMKVADRDTSKVKIDPYFNNDMWFRGPNNAPNKVRVKVTKKNDEVFVTFVETPKMVSFEKIKHEKRHSKSGQKAVEKKEDKTEKSEEAKKAESEKEKSSAEQKEKIAVQHAKEQKHTTTTKEPKIHRMALKK